MNEAKENTSNDVFQEPSREAASSKSAGPLFRVGGLHNGPESRRALGASVSEGLEAF